MKREYVLWTIAEKKKVLKEYDKAEKGWKFEVLEKHNIHASHIASWRKQLADIVK